MERTINLSEVNRTFFEEVIKSYMGRTLPCCYLSCKLGGKKLKSAKASGADCMVTLCPYCQMQFDYYQSIIEKKLDERFALPVVLFTQLLGLCMGLSPEEVGLNMNRVSADTILDFIK